MYRTLSTIRTASFKCTRVHCQTTQTGVDHRRSVELELVHAHMIRPSHTTADMTLTCYAAGFQEPPAASVVSSAGSAEPLAV